MRVFLTSIAVVLLLLAGTASLTTASAAPAAQAQPTAYLSPTPLPNGKIVYLVQKGDTLWTIAANTGVSISDLEQLNDIHREDALAEGKSLVLKIVQPATAEPTLAFEETSTPTPLPVTGKGEICVSFFNDLNGDASRATDTEGFVAGGQISVALSNGTEIGTTTSDGVAAYCFKDIPSGEYNIAAAAPQNYNPTTEMNQRRTLEPGDKVYVSFGVQSNAPGTGTGEAQSGGSSPILAIAGIALLGIAGFILYSVLRPKRTRRW